MHMLCILKIYNIYLNMFIYVYIYTNIIYIEPFKSFFLKAKHYCFIFLNLMTDYYFMEGD